MLSVSTYAEPVPVKPASVSEFPQAQPLEDNRDDQEEQPSFAELLAGLLRDPEQAVAVPVAETNCGEVSNDEFVDLNKNPVFNEIQFLENDEKAPLIDAKAALVDMNDLAGTQRLFNDLETIAAEANEGEFYKELSNLIKSDHASEIKIDADLLNGESKNFDISQLTEQNEAQTVQAAQSINEVLAETTVKKDRTQKTSNINEKIAVKADKNENAEADARMAALRARPENQKLGKLDELRASRRDRRDSVTVEVRDMRTGSADSVNSQNRGFAAIETSVGRLNDASSVRELTLELKIPQQNEAINQANTSWEAKSSGALENLLARELHQNFNGDIIRHASMALRDGGEGTIKIALKPESLGNVKIALELADNKITGKIFVESEEALNAFRKEIASLEQGFKDAGFAAADLNLSLTSQGQDAQGWDKSPLIPNIAASRYDENSDRIEDENAVRLVNVFIGHKKSSINMLA